MKVNKRLYGPSADERLLSLVNTAAKLRQLTELLARRAGFEGRGRFPRRKAMRRILMVAASAAALALSGAGAGATNLGGSGLRIASDALGIAHQARRVCREVCRDGYCRQRCWDEPEYRERRVYRQYDYDDDPPPVRVYPRYERAPGLGIYGPGIGLEFGGGW
jgi:hypothetical protein